MSILNRLHLYCNNTFVPFYQHPQEDASQLGDLEKFLRALRVNILNKPHLNYNNAFVSIYIFLVPFKGTLKARRFKNTFLALSLVSMVMLLS